MSWSASVLTLFPDIFPGPLAVSLVGKALSRGLWQLKVRDIREHGIGRHRSVDDTPAGGGPGMVMRADVACAAIDAALADGAQRPVIYLTPRGRLLDQARIHALASGPGVTLLCGRFEGLDERAIEARQLEEVSIGDFVLAGGEIPALALIEACVRLIPGVLGAEASAAEDTFSGNLLEYPQFTRPQSFEGRNIPAVLTSGDHAQIARWRRQQAEALTKSRRPDLFSLYESGKL
ncbi:MAG: tRNA (guanosine(37)-N1)-methyltransferase TrmD [Alphaproteobacteria bacterium]|nr:tRNA (guanosine(37)-N1)-methyltransferase TrmD [Alphaproteobacteria bacterium]